MQGKFFEAFVTKIDTEKKTIVACFPDDLGIDTACFQLDYDILVMGESVGRYSSPRLSSSNFHKSSSKHLGVQKVKVIKLKSSLVERSEFFRQIKIPISYCVTPSALFAV